MSDFKPVTVAKLIPNTFDLGNLATFDPNPLDNAKLADPNTRNQHLNEVTRDNVQLLINQILSLPVKTTTDNGDATSTGQSSSMTLIQLPDPSTPLPREKAIPKAKAMTKWEKFAAKKGIQSKAKDGKMVYDEATGEWVPKWGYKGKNKDIDSQWLVEVEDKVKNTDKELIDPRTLARSERKRLVKKNELQHKRNSKNGASEYQPHEYLPTIDAILSVADLEKVSVKKIRNALQELFAIDLGPHKQEVNDLIMERYYSLVDQRARDSTTEQERRAEMEAQDAIMAARLSKTPLRSARATRVTKLTTKRTAPKNNPFNKPMGLSGELANVVGESTLSRPQVVKKLWEYIKEHQLQNPSDKRVIICDNLLRDLFKKKSVGAFEMNKLLSKHIFPLSEAAQVEQDRRSETEDKQAKSNEQGKLSSPVVKPEDSSSEESEA
ncbi:Uncharacterized protein ABC855_g550 [[Candida] zeylanoides]